MMRNKDYFREIGMEPEDLSKTLDLASDRILCSIVFPNKTVRSAQNPAKRPIVFYPAGKRRQSAVRGKTV